MNTGGLPFVNDSNGTLKVTIISTVLEAAFLLITLFVFMKNRK